MKKVRRIGFDKFVTIETDDKQKKWIKIIENNIIKIVRNPDQTMLEFAKIESKDNI